MPHGKFDPVLHVENKVGGDVLAAGPLDPLVHKVVDMCVWVIQRDNTADVIANNMGRPIAGNEPEPDEHAGHAGMAGMPGMPGMPGMAGDLTILHRGTADARWTFTLPQKFRKLTFAEAGASAMAVGVFEDAAGNQRTFQWSETVLLAYGPVPAPPLLAGS